MTVSTQDYIDKSNENFWNELCGTQLAKQLGVTDSSKSSLTKFDDFYWNYYPYLKKYLFLDKLAGANVLEIGLGYGTVSQILAQAGCNYHGLDIAPNAAAMAAHRLEQHNIQGDLRVGSMLECPFSDNYFDYVISIGCFHHTGNMARCIDETYRILKPNGTAVIMVYNKFSLRQWNSWPFMTAKNLFGELFFKKSQLVTDAQRKAYDKSGEEEGAPETQFFSKKEIHCMMSKFKNVDVMRENFDEDFALKLGKKAIFSFDKRQKCLNSIWTQMGGLDLYIVAKK